MTEFVSEIKTIPYSEERIFPILSDLSRVEQVKDKIPADKLDKIKDFACDTDSCTINIDPVGNVKFVIVERIPNNTIKFGAEQVPFDFHMWVQLKQVSENETKMKLSIKADLNMFLKPMLSTPIQEGLNKIAEVLANLPYDKID